MWRRGLHGVSLVVHDGGVPLPHPQEPGMSGPDLTDWRGQRATRIEHLERILEALEAVVVRLEALEAVAVRLEALDAVVVRLEALEQTSANRAALDLVTELAKERPG